GDADPQTSQNGRSRTGRREREDDVAVDDAVRGAHGPRHAVMSLDRYSLERRGIERDRRRHAQKRRVAGPKRSVRERIFQQRPLRVDEDSVARRADPNPAGGRIDDVAEGVHSRESADMPSTGKNDLRGPDAARAGMFEAEPVADGGAGAGAGRAVLLRPPAGGPAGGTAHRRTGIRLGVAHWGVEENRRCHDRNAGGPDGESDSLRSKPPRDTVRGR